MKQQERFVQAISSLPVDFRQKLEQIPQLTQTRIEEVRLRVGQPPTYRENGIEIAFATQAVTSANLRDLLAQATHHSVHSYGDCLAQGFLPLAGGHRLGLCGTAVVQQGRVEGFRALSSVTVRIASARAGMGDGVISHIYANERLQNTLILSPPNGGKTTLLRDCIRQLSDRGLQVGVVDARGEIAAMHAGAPQFDVGRCTDVLAGCPSAQGALQLVRTMSPQLLAFDEITAPEDGHALTYAANCGVHLLATIHARNRQELQQKPLYRDLLAQGIFQTCVTIVKSPAGRKITVENLST